MECQCGECRRTRLFKETQETLGKLSPVIRDIFWIARTWNDHNFNEQHLRDKCKSITDALVGGNRIDRLDPCDAWLERFENVMKQLEKQNENSN